MRAVGSSSTYPDSPLPGRPPRRRRSSCGLRAGGAEGFAALERGRAGRDREGLVPSCARDVMVVGTSQSLSPRVARAEARPDGSRRPEEGGCIDRADKLVPRWRHAAGCSPAAAPPHGR